MNLLASQEYEVQSKLGLLLNDLVKICNLNVFSFLSKPVLIAFSGQKKTSLTVSFSPISILDKE